MVEALKTKNIIQQAEAEVQEELTKEAKEKLKRKLREQAQAKQVLQNIDREIEEIKLELKHDLGDAGGHQLQRDGDELTYHSRNGNHEGQREERWSEMAHRRESKYAYDAADEGKQCAAVPEDLATGGESYPARGPGDSNQYGTPETRRGLQGNRAESGEGVAAPQPAAVGYQPLVSGSGVRVAGDRAFGSRRFPLLDSEDAPLLVEHQLLAIRLVPLSEASLVDLL